MSESRRQSDSLSPISGAGKVVVISRCAWTLFNFRLSLMDAAAAQGREVIALGSAGDGFEGKLLSHGVDFRPVRLSKRGIAPIDDLRLLVDLVRVLAKERPSVVHCFTIKPAIFGTIAAWLCGVRVRVVTITGLGHAFTSAKPWLTRVVMALYRFALRRAHFVFFQNSTDRALFVQNGLAASDASEVVAGSGIDTSRFEPVPLPIASGESGVTFLMIARLIREKGINEFLGAAEKVKASHPSTRFVLLGYEDPRNPSALTRAEVESLAASRVVKWAGGSDDVRPAIRRADVVVLPSYREGLPRALLEGAAMARPAIATDTVGCRDVVVDGVTGYLVRVKDVEALAEAMEKFIRSPQNVTIMGAAARKRVVECFDEKAVIRSALRKYDEIFAETL